MDCRDMICKEPKTYRVRIMKRCRNREITEREMERERGRGEGGKEGEEREGKRERDREMECKDLCKEPRLYRVRIMMKRCRNREMRERERRGVESREMTCQN